MYRTITAVHETALTQLATSPPTPVNSATSNHVPHHHSCPQYSQFTQLATSPPTAVTHSATSNRVQHHHSCPQHSQLTHMSIETSQLCKLHENMFIQLELLSSHQTRSPRRTKRCTPIHIDKCSILIVFKLFAKSYAATL